MRDTAELGDEQERASMAPGGERELPLRYPTAGSAFLAVVTGEE